MNPPRTDRLSPRRTFVLTAVAMLAFAANSLLCRAALGAARIDAVTFTTVRMVSGAVVLLGLVRTRRPAASAGSWPSGAALFGYAIAFSLAYTRIAAGIGALVLFGAVQASMIGYALAGGARLRRGEWIGLTTALVGLIVLTRPGLEAPDGLGILLMTLAGIAWGVYSVRGLGRQDPLAATAGNFVRASVSALVISLGTTWFMAPHWSWQGLVLAAVSGAFASGVGYAIWYAALPGLSSTSAAIVQLSAPLLAAIGGIALLGEVVTVRLGLATPLLLGGIALAVLVKPKSLH